MSFTQQKLTILGPAVLDHLLKLKPGTNHGKGECELIDRLGGGAINATRAAQIAGVETTLISLVGEDPCGLTVSKLVRAEFSESLVVKGMTATRQSLLDDRGGCLTQRSPVSLSQLPPFAQRQLAEAGHTLITPFAREDYPFVVNALAANPRSILMLSKSQLSDPEQATALARKSYAVVVNHQEMHIWTGETDLTAGVRCLSEQHDLPRVVVTSPEKIVACVDEHWLEIAPLKVESVVRTVGAGDCFVGTMAASLAQNQGWKVALRQGLHASARFVSSPEPGPTTIKMPDVSYPLATSRRSAISTTVAVSLGLLMGVGVSQFIHTPADQSQDNSEIARTSPPTQRRG